MQLIVIEPFSSYKRGDLITDAGIIAAILSTEDARFVAVLGNGTTPPAAPTPESWLDLLAKGIPQLIDALPDAQGRPPLGYEWVSGAGAVPNYAASALDFGVVIRTYFGFEEADVITAVPGTQFVSVTRAENSNAALLVSPNFLLSANLDTGSQTLVKVLGVKTLASDFETGSFSVFAIFETHDDEGGRFARSHVVDQDGVVTNASSLALGSVVLDAQAVATVGGYHLQRVMSGPFGATAWLAISEATGDMSFLESAGSTLPLVTGPLMAAEGDEALVSNHLDAFCRYRKLAIDTSGASPKVAAPLRLTVAMMPGTTSAYLAGAATALAGGGFVLATRAGFFEVTVSDGTATVKQSAGVHPMLRLDSVDTPVTERDFASLGFAFDNADQLVGISHSGNKAFYVDYPTLKSLFIRKAQLTTA